jgi:hypothetical protein
MAFTFPSSPSIGDEYLAPSGVIYFYDGTWSSTGESISPNPFDNRYLYRTIYTKGYMTGGYKSGSPWRNVNKTIHATDLTTNLGDVMSRPASYIGGGWSDYYTFIYPSGGSHNVVSNVVESMSMTTETARALDSKMYMKTSRGDAEGLLTPSLTAAYIVGGGSTAVDKHNYVTDVMFAAGTAPASPLDGGTNRGLGALFGEFKAWISEGVGSSMDWATETWTTSGMAWASNGQPKGLSSKHGHGYGSIGSYDGNVNVYKFSDNTGANLATLVRPKKSGEENWQVGQNWGYQIGAYDGAAQTNDAAKINYLTDTLTTMGSDTEPKGHAGSSSGTCASGAAVLVGN